MIIDKFMGNVRQNYKIFDFKISTYHLNLLRQYRLIILIEKVLSG